VQQRFWLYGPLVHVIHAPATVGTVPPLGIEVAAMTSGMLSWCALVAAPIALSASSTVLVVCVVPSHPLDGRPIKWGPEVRVPLRQALSSSRWAGVSGSVRILEYKCRRDGRRIIALDRERLRVWAARRLRDLGAEHILYEDKMDSLFLTTHTNIC